MQALPPASGKGRENNGLVRLSQVQALTNDFGTDMPASDITADHPQDPPDIADPGFLIDSAEILGLDDSSFGMDLLGFDFNF